MPLVARYRKRVERGTGGKGIKNGERSQVDSSLPCILNMYFIRLFLEILWRAHFMAISIICVYLKILWWWYVGLSQVRPTVVVRRNLAGRSCSGGWYVGMCQVGMSSNGGK